MSKHEIDKMIQEAERFEQIDNIYSLKVGFVHQINSICNSILINLKDDAYSLTKTDKKKIRLDVKNNLKWLKDKELGDLDIKQLKKRVKRLSKLYSPLIAQVNKKNDKFKDLSTVSNIAEVHGDDADNDNTIYEKIKLQNDPSEYEKEEIKELKKSIYDLGNNILNVVNNPVSNFSEEDIISVTDYIGSVHIWLYTTNASTTIEFVSKINEINKFTEEIMKKYEDKYIFEKQDNFTLKDELQLTCLTLNTSLKSNYFSLKKTDVDKLTQIINDTMLWLLTHQNEDNNKYQEKINEISEICNSIYHSIHKMKILENIEMAEDQSSSDEESDEESVIPDVPDNNKIKEDIDLLMEKLPDKLTHKVSISSEPKNEDVLLKIDINKLKAGSNSSFKYKNTDMFFR